MASESARVIRFKLTSGNIVIQADMDRFGEDGSLDDNVESFLSHDEADARESLFGSSKRSPAGHSVDVTKGHDCGQDHL